ncbi:hypothetical protein HELRODRAFT_181146 [Helobdella robusta]|uniref:VWFA domain-containing protein n=1 Tax=Helobdella robusta TaxID=6412 RepID=T1FGP0_HELRO|nr:hypothetical protein HELRODRAFT_181146 [Helobdella robusta]ESN93219.1 hypothetical protein HELRODRAFT_181146 [Helobdella robusta]
MLQMYQEAIAIVLDVGPSMTQNMYLVESLQLIKMILQRKLFSESKDEIMLILFGTRTSKNQLFNGQEYRHITVEKPLMQVNFELIQYVQNIDAHYKGQSADFVDAVVVAMDELKRCTEGKKIYSSKRIILLSNLMEKFNDDQLDDILASLKESHFEFNYIGTCLENWESESDKGKTHQQANGEVNAQKTGLEVIRRILDEVDGDYFSLKQLLPCLSFIQSRSVRPTAWKANLKIGSSLEIPICLYTRHPAYIQHKISRSDNQGQPLVGYAYRLVIENN